MKKLALLIGVLVLLMGCSSAQPTVAPAPAAAHGSGQVAYIQGGDLWIKQLPNGEARRLTQDSGYSSPSWSPSGSWLLARRGEEIRSISTGSGGQHQLTSAGETTVTVWAPHTDRVAVLTAGEGIKVVDPDGSSEQKLVTTGIGEHITHAAWSPDGQYIGYDLVRRGTSPLSATAALYRVAVAGGQPEKLYAAVGDGPQCLILAGWTPDGKDLLFWPQSMCSASLLADGAGLLALPAGGEQPQDLGIGMLIHPDFLALSPSGKLAVTNGGGRETWRMKRIVVAQSVPGKGQEVSPAGMAAISPAWAPDGSRLAYTAMPNAAESVSGGEQAKAALQGRHIWVTNADGSGSRQLTTDQAYRDERPRWTGDGKAILFARMAAGGTASLWLTPADGGAPAQVAAMDAPSGQWFGFYGWLDWDSVFDLRQN